MSCHLLILSTALSKVVLLRQLLATKQLYSSASTKMEERNHKFVSELTRGVTKVILYLGLYESKIPGIDRINWYPRLHEQSADLLRPGRGRSAIGAFLLVSEIPRTVGRPLAPGNEQVD